MLFPASPGHIQVSFFYPPFVDCNGDIHNVNVIFNVWDNPPASPYVGRTDARIWITIKIIE